MPTYDFRCEHCDKEFKDVLLVHWNDAEVCPECKLVMKKLVPSEMRVHFKGWWPGESLKKKEGGE